MKAKEFEQQFDDGVDLTASWNLSKVRRVMQDQKRVNVDFPTWMVDSWDCEASKLGSRGSPSFKSGLLSGCKPVPRIYFSHASASAPHTVKA